MGGYFFRNQVQGRPKGSKKATHTNNCLLVNNKDNKRQSTIKQIQQANKRTRVTRVDDDGCMTCLFVVVVVVIIVVVVTVDARLSPLGDSPSFSLFSDLNSTRSTGIH